MILYLSSATDQDLFDSLQKQGLIVGPCPAQNFNYNIMLGLSRYDQLISVSSLPYVDKRVQRHIVDKGQSHYIAIKNYKGKIRKLMNIVLIIREAQKYLRKEKTNYILVDATSVSANISAYLIKKLYRKKTCAIITDIPTFMNEGNLSFADNISERLMGKYDGYVVLTAPMLKYLKVEDKPHITVEGLFNGADICEDNTHFQKEKICVYSGALWEKLGIEEMVEGFSEAGINGYKLYIYGDGSWRKQIEAICEKYENVEYKGCVSLNEIRSIQRKATLLINPRKTGGEYTKYSFPSKTIEYMASGTPVLTTRLPGIPEEYSDYVYYVDDETSEGFANAFKQVLSKSAIELDNKGLSAKSFIKNEKNAEVQTKKIFDLLGNAI